MVRGEWLGALEHAVLETLLREGQAAFALHDAHTRYLMVSQALAAACHREVPAFLGRRPAEVLPSGLAEVVQQGVERVLSTGTAARAADPRAWAPDEAGEPPRVWQWLPVLGPAGTLIGVVSMLVDVTERSSQREALRRHDRRLARLTQMTTRLASALTIDEVVRAVRELGRGIGAHRSEVRLLKVDPDRARPRRARGQSGWSAPAAVQPPADWPSLLRAAVAGNVPLYVGNAAELRACLPHQRVSDAQAGPDERAWVVLPLAASGVPLGVLRLAFREERQVSADDRTFLEALAGQCALAVERSRMYEREHQTAVALQRSLLPARLPEIPGAEVRFRYLPGASDVEVGGDWYDAFQLPSGKVALVVGDVIGKGLGAAAGMGRVRSALRALAFTDPEPVAVVSGLDRLFTATESEESLTTLIYAVIDPASGLVDMADAGHLPVLIVSADGAARFVDAGPASTPLGVPEQRVQCRLRLAAGDLVLGFSDGLVENRRRGLGEGLDTLLTVARGHRGGLDDLLDLVVDRLLAGQERDDDMTVIGFRLTAPR